MKSKTSVFLLGMSAMSVIAWLLTRPIYTEVSDLRATLADLHHCVSVCVEQFEKMGC